MGSGAGVDGGDLRHGHRVLGGGVLRLARAAWEKTRKQPPRCIEGPMNRLLRRLLVAMIFGVAVYAAFALYRGLREIGDSLRHFHWSAFAMACSLAFGNYLTRF